MAIALYEEDLNVYTGFDDGWQEEKKCLTDEF
jgi:hypothetical protein